jgi:hypothetical protein
MCNLERNFRVIQTSITSSLHGPLQLLIPTSLYFMEVHDSSKGFSIFFLNLDHQNRIVPFYKSVFFLRQTRKIANLNTNTCASNSAILSKDACSMQARRLHSSSSKPVIWYLSSAIS